MADVHAGEQGVHVAGQAFGVEQRQLAPVLVEVGLDAAQGIGFVGQRGGELDVVGLAGAGQVGQVMTSVDGELTSRAGDEGSAGIIRRRAALRKLPGRSRLPCV